MIQSGQGGHYAPSEDVRVFVVINPIVYLRPHNQCRAVFLIQAHPKHFLMQGTVLEEGVGEV
jgi:hypothetical protein